MNKKLATFLLIVILSLIILIIKFNDIKLFLYLNDYNGNAQNYKTIWALSDLHIDDKQKLYFKNAVHDISTVFRKIDIALVAGDIIDYKNSERFLKYYVSIKRSSSIKKWYEISGNHDNYDIINFRKYIKKPRYYSIVTGNILLLFLSDENWKNETFISKKSFNWWKSKVINNQDKVIITVTHGFLIESGLSGKEVVDQIKDSKRFIDVLKKYKVDLWINGHLHISHKWAGSRIKTVKSLNNTNFLNVASLENSKYIPSNSCILLVKNNDDKILVISRNHFEKNYVNEGFKFLDLSKKVKF